MNTKYSAVHKAANILKALPISKPGYFIRGNVISILIKYGLPLFLVLTAAIIYIWDFSVWPNILFGFCNSIFVCMTFALFGLKNIPFSESLEDQSKGSNTGTMFVLMFFTSLLGLGHYFIREFTMILLIGSLVSFCLAAFMYNRISKIKWKEIS